MPRGLPRTGTMGRESESMGVQACPAFSSDEKGKTMLSLITAQLVPLAFCFIITGRFKGLGWAGYDYGEPAAGGRVHRHSGS
ncbi:hypothetical protein PoB_004405200 [Plakobranchus ocellatus]|uniref:Uncharacterized protein n=1 Tax=Plakobranchus ocellatus TaxID=259542 RepID=A0AAV4BEC9_9GAST|nr:hypothetical protein PoB_004405200 [Plakobranchus ocellatus]